MQKWLWVVVAVLALAAGLWLSASFKSTPAEPVAALVYPSPRTLTEFNLLDEQKQQVGLKDLQGHWTLVFVGYTHCPDICPMTMAKLAAMYQDLVKLTPDPLEIWFVSVDPNGIPQNNWPSTSPTLNKPLSKPELPIIKTCFLLSANSA